MNNLFNQKLLIQKAQEEINLSDYFEKRKILKLMNKDVLNFLKENNLNPTKNKSLTLLLWLSK